MLTLGYTRAAHPTTFLGEQPPTEDYSSVPLVVLDRVGYLAQAHAALQRSEELIAAMKIKIPQLPVDLLITHNNAVDTALPAVKAFLEGDGSTSNPGYLNAPGVENITPVYAARVAISDPITGELAFPTKDTVLAGFGAAGGLVDSSSIRFVRDASGERFAGVEVLTAEQILQETGDAGLGAGLLLPIIIIAAVAVTTFAILWTIRDVAAQVTIREQQRAWAKACAALARTAEAIAGSYYKVYSDCAASATTVEQKTVCMKTASEAAAQVAKSIPAMPAFPKTAGGESWLWWIGLAVVIAAVAVGGYAIYKRRKRTQAVEVVETATEAKAVPAEA